jgi:hypothetical protein
METTQQVACKFCGVKVNAVYGGLYRHQENCTQRVIRLIVR